jgi:hypothetical protein
MDFAVIQSDGCRHEIAAATQWTDRHATNPADASGSRDAAPARLDRGRQRRQHSLLRRRRRHPAPPTPHSGAVTR